MFEQFAHSCIPIRIVEFPTPDTWLGGAPPAGIVPTLHPEQIGHLLTVNLEQQSKVLLSVLVSMEDLDDELSNNKFRLLEERESCAKCFLHASSQAVGHYSNFLIPKTYGIMRLDPISERYESLQKANESDQIFTGHKLGGWPVYHHPRRELFAETERALADGYIHILQLGFSDSNDAEVRGNWPLEEYIFHVFAKYYEGHFSFLTSWG